jgi:hypothetical protein
MDEAFAFFSQAENLGLITPDADSLADENRGMGAAARFHRSAGIGALSLLVAQTHIQCRRKPDRHGGSCLLRAKLRESKVKNLKRLYKYLCMQYCKVQAKARAKGTARDIPTQCGRRILITSAKNSFAGIEER